MTSPSLKPRDIEENGGSSAVSHTPEIILTPEVVSGNLVAALRSMTSPFHEVIMAAGPLLTPHPFFGPPPLLTLSDLAAYQNVGARRPNVARRSVDGGVDSAGGSEDGNGRASCDEDCVNAVCSVASVSPLDLSPQRTERVNNFRHHGNLMRIINSPYATYSLIES